MQVWRRRVSTSAPIPALLVNTCSSVVAPVRPLSASFDMVCLFGRHGHKHASYAAPGRLDFRRAAAEQPLAVPRAVLLR